MTRSEVIQNRADIIESEVAIDVRYEKFHEVTLGRESESRSVKGYFYFWQFFAREGIFLRNKPGTPLYRVRCRKKKYARSIRDVRQAIRILTPPGKEHGWNGACLYFLMPIITQGKIKINNGHIRIYNKSRGVIRFPDYGIEMG